MAAAPHKPSWAPPFQNIYNLITQQGMDFQLLLSAVAITVALLSAKLLQSFLQRKFSTGSRWTWAVRNVAPEMLSPTLALVGLICSIWITSLFEVLNKTVYVGMLKVVLAWWLARLLQLVSRRHFIAYFAGAAIICYTLLDVTELLEPTVDFLSDIKLETSTVKLSLLGIIKGISTLVFLFWGAGVFSSLAESWMRTMSFSFNARELCIKFIRIALYFSAIVITLNQIGVDLTAFTVFGGALGVGIGFGLQKITSNFISGIILLFERTIVAGDLIEVGNEKGWVRQMAVRHTLIETFDGREMLIPNEELITGKVTNWTYTNTRARAEIVLTITYASDLKKAMELMLGAGKHYKLSLAGATAPVCVIKEFTDRGVQLGLVFWIPDVKSGLGVARSEVMLEIAERFKANNIAFATVS